jgi:hypothetical protein
MRIKTGRESVFGVYLLCMVGEERKDSTTGLKIALLITYYSCNRAKPYSASTLGCYIRLDINHDRFFCSENLQ